MKRILLLLTLPLLFFSCQLTSSSKLPTNVEKKQTDLLEVLYFHGKQRCITCNAIEKLSKEVVDSLKNKKIVLHIIDISQAENEAKANQYEVTWSALILDQGGRKENLTEMAFQYAKNNPAKFKTMLLESINKMLP
ncbi:MAG: nitrophenyl compound nitroreductase subunit ArsF family protein [Bacteroidales bacterium]